MDWPTKMGEVIQFPDNMVKVHDPMTREEIIHALETIGDVYEEPITTLTRDQMIEGPIVARSLRDSLRAAGVGLMAGGAAGFGSVFFHMSAFSLVSCTT